MIGVKANTILVVSSILFLTGEETDETCYCSRLGQLGGIILVLSRQVNQYLQIRFLGLGIFPTLNQRIEVELDNKTFDQRADTLIAQQVCGKLLFRVRMETAKLSQTVQDGKFLQIVRRLISLRCQIIEAILDNLRDIIARLGEIGHLGSCQLIGWRINERKQGFHQAPGARLLDVARFAAHGHLQCSQFIGQLVKIIIATCKHSNIPGGYLLTQNQLLNLECKRLISGVGPETQRMGNGSIIPILLRHREGHFFALHLTEHLGEDGIGEVDQWLYRTIGMLQMFLISDAVGHSGRQICIRATETIDGLFLVAHIAGIEQLGERLEDTHLYGI